MHTSRRTFLTALAAGAATWRCSTADPQFEGITRYVRYRHEGGISFGVLEGDTIREIEGDLFGDRQPTGTSVSLDQVKLLYPVEPSKILALAGNYKSHLGDEAPNPNPEIFYKPITALQNPEDEIIFPEGAQDVHFEAEFVIVIGKRAKNVSEQEAPDYILGYTCGNDVSERNWQNGSLGDQKDLQWWRAKGSETFAPLGPAISVGLDYEKSEIRLRLNGEIKQQEPLTSLIAKPPEIVSFISRYVTLLPGDVIYTGTPGQTSRLAAGDVVEVEIDGIGVLRNTVTD